MSKKSVIDLSAMRTAVKAERIEWQRHALERMIERGIMRNEVKEVLFHGECIEEYPEDYPLLSALFSGKPKDRRLHVVAAYNTTTDYVFIITAYEPDLEHFMPDLRTRRKK